jgi:hypothetical protein
MVIASGVAAILAALLSEADFFVDGKDLQTFVSAVSQAALFFFAPRRRRLGVLLLRPRVRPVSIDALRA